MSDVSNASSSHSSHSQASRSESESSARSHSDSLSSNDSLSGALTSSEMLSSQATTEQQLAANPTSLAQLASEKTTEQQLSGVESQPSVFDQQASELVENNTRTHNARGGLGATQRINTDALANEVVARSHTNPAEAEALTQALSNKLDASNTTALEASLTKAYAQQSQAYQALAGNTLTGKVEVSAADAQALADTLLEQVTHTTTPRSRSGSGHSVSRVDVNELAYQLGQHAQQTPALAIGAKLSIDQRLTSQQMGELNRLLGGGDRFSDNLDMALSHPVEGAVGAAKNMVNGLSDLGELMLQGSAQQQAAASLQHGAMMSLFNKEQGMRVIDNAQAMMDAAKTIDLPTFALSNRAQKGGAVIGTVAELATGVGALVKGGIKLTTKADDVIEVVLKQGDDVTRNTPTTHVPQDYVSIGKTPDAPDAATGARLGERRISQALYDELRDATPTPAIRDKVNEGKVAPFPDEALPGFTVTRRLEADHIVSMDRITRMEGFDKLTVNQQLSVLNNPDNFIGLSRSANASKGAQTFAQWTTHKRSGTPVNPEFRERMMVVEQRLEITLQQQIDNFVALNRS